MFIREELNTRKKEQLELLANRFQGDLAALSLQSLASAAATSSSGSNATQGIAIGQQLLE